MDLQKISLFIQVMKLGNFAEAGRSLDLDPSVVSRSISILERDLAVRLFHRTTRKLSPTEQGHAFFRSVEPLIEELNKAKLALQDQKNKPSGVLRITCPVSFGVLIVNPLLPKFHKNYPNIQVEFLITDSVLNLLEERIDVAIRFGHLDDSSFIANKLTDLEYIVCASPKYLKQHPPIKKPADLVNHNCHQFLFPGFNSGWRFRAKNSQKEEVIRVQGQLKASNAIVLIDAALAGSGLALLAKVLVKNELDKGQLVNVLPNYEATATEYGAGSWILYPSKDFVPAKTRAFIDFIKEEVPKI